MSALVHITMLSARHRLAERGAIMARVLFYGIILFVFSRLWDAVLEGSAALEAERHQLVWYLAITEWIVLSGPPLHTDIEEEVRRGDLVYRLARPMSYPLTKLAEGLGDLLVRMATLGAAGLLFAWLITERLPTSPVLMLWLLPLGLLAGVWTLSMFFIIGLTSFWLHDCRPVYWIWQKSAFILGGLLVPIELYPDWLFDIAVHSPFAAVLHGPGSIALGQDSTGALWTLAHLLVWIIVTILVLAWTFRRSLTRLEIGGG